MGNDLISRRKWVVAAGLAGFGAAAADARASLPSATLTGPYVDVTTAEGARLALERLSRNVDPSSPRVDRFDGTVMAVAADGSVTPLMSVRGRIETRGTQRKLFATYYDTQSGQPLSAFHNPLTGADVKVSHIDGAASETAFSAGQWRQVGVNFEVQQAVQADYGAVSGLSVTTHHGTLADLQDPALTTLPDSGSWTLVTPWLPWLEMGNTPGHCVFQCTRRGGADLPVA